MNLQQLEYFKIIAEVENFTKASNLLSVSQPALSKAISKLEEELGVPLFEKSGRNIKLTRFGKMFLSHTKTALLEINKGIKELKEITNSNTDSISISSTSSVGTYFMPFIISNFLNENPNTKFQFNHESVKNIICDLKSGKIDLGFYECIEHINIPSEIESIPIRKEEYVLIVPKNHYLSNKSEVSLKELENESFVAFCIDSKDKMISYSEFLGYIPKISIRPSEASMLEGLVAAGAGISIVPNTPIINTNSVSILKIKEKIKDKTIYMGWLKDAYMSPIAKIFKDFVISTI
ncbi:LysR substrate-binding domain-containing protein [Clostridium tertium]|jgi:DNA-binding transcriptional LysR family regulator|uniref:LysR substrate-binding domain-containing protein n=1 Tax=Clostridium tertium TaxID=1559 RepID=A0A9X3XJ03_9CLOT|nr:LysR substrate-binding domain-containing protein [Clostridium tertium]MDB1942319.1 LysR substrate-binding domain-containing protein [Clostridium tertium]MDC4239818.1 LysR substrate-binding domain-containing protein [Clostridium tertium]MDY4605835.1 LysR substrate-binding domain-containing protein [Clostridium tertium]